MKRVDQIRATLDLPAEAVAERFGMRLKTVREMRSKVRKPDKYREHEVRYRRNKGYRPQDEVIAEKRERSPWKQMDAELIRLVRLGVARSEIGAKLGVSKNAVIGRWHKLVRYGMVQP